MSSLLPHFRCYHKLTKISLNLSTKCVKRLIGSESQSMNRMNECIKYYPMIGYNNISINEMDPKISPILDQWNPKKSYVLRNAFVNPVSKQINPILVPNLIQFPIIDKNKSPETDCEDMTHKDKDNDKNKKEMPGSGTGRRLYLDYRIIRDPRRYSHLTIIRHKKMSKHKRRKWKKKMLAFLKKTYLRKNIKKEKTFRAELLAQIKEAEEFDAEKYVKTILKTIDDIPTEDSREQRMEWINDMIRKNRRETNLIKPKFDD